MAEIAPFHAASDRTYTRPWEHPGRVYVPSLESGGFLNDKLLIGHPAAVQTLNTARLESLERACEYAESLLLELVLRLGFDVRGTTTTSLHNNKSSQQQVFTTTTARAGAAPRLRCARHNNKSSQQRQVFTTTSLHNNKSSQQHVFTTASRRAFASMCESAPAPASASASASVPASASLPQVAFTQTKIVRRRADLYIPDVDQATINAFISK